jgi:hypothetical protein
MYLEKCPLSVAFMCTVLADSGVWHREKPSLRPRFREHALCDSDTSLTSVFVYFRRRSLLIESAFEAVAASWLRLYFRLRRYLVRDSLGSPCTTLTLQLQPFIDISGLMSCHRQVSIVQLGARRTASVP